MLQQLHTAALKWWGKRATCTRHAAGYRGGGQGGGVSGLKALPLLFSKAPPLLFPSNHVRTAVQIQLERIGERQDKVLEPVLLPPVPLGQRAEDFPQIERFVPRHRKVDMSFLSSKNLVRFIFESFPINLRYCSRSCFPSSSWTFSCN